MLTIRVIREDGGEFVDEAKYVVCDLVGKGSSKRSVINYYKDDASPNLAVGTVFVMNENGKTVAKYIGHYIGC